MEAQPAEGKVLAGRYYQQSPVARRPADRHTQPARGEVARAVQEVELPGREQQQVEGQGGLDVLPWHRQQQQAQQVQREQQEIREPGVVRVHLFPCQCLGSGLRSSAVKHRRRLPCLRAWREELGL